MHCIGNLRIIAVLVSIDLDGYDQSFLRDIGEVVTVFEIASGQKQDSGDSSQP